MIKEEEEGIRKNRLDEYRWIVYVEKELQWKLGISRKRRMEDGEDKEEEEEEEEEAMEWNGTLEEKED